MHIIQGIILGVVEGLTEFIPVSSTGHLIITHQLLGLTTGDTLGIDATLQLAAGCALLAYFFKDFLALAYTALYKITGRPVEKEQERLMWAIIVGTIPAVILGLLLEHAMETIFRNVHLVAYATAAGAVVMLFAERSFRRHAQKNILADVPALSMSDVTPKRGFWLGLWQCLPLIPGMSRSGMVISGGLFMGFSREAAARFSFLLSVPIIFGSGAKKILELWGSGALQNDWQFIAAGCVASFITSILAVSWLLKYLRTHSLTPFIIYRFALAVVIFLFL